MPRLKSPLFSLDASGSLANTVTYQGGSHRQRAISTSPGPGPLSPAQLNHQFLYALGVGLWRGFTVSDRSPYVALASRRNATPMSIWLQTWLTTLPNLQLAIPFNGPATAPTIDVSPNPATFVNTNVDQVLLGKRPAVRFDGTTSWIEGTNTAKLNFTTQPFTVLCAAQSQAPNPTEHLVTRSINNAQGWSLDIINVGTQLSLATWSPGNEQRTRSTSFLNPSLPYILATTRSDAVALTYINGINRTNISGDHTTIGSSTSSLTIARRSTVSTTYWPGLLQWIAIFNRALTAAEIAGVNSIFQPWLTT